MFTGRWKEKIDVGVTQIWLLHSVKDQPQTSSVSNCSQFPNETDINHVSSSLQSCVLKLLQSTQTTSYYAIMVSSVFSSV